MSFECEYIFSFCRYVSYSEIEMQCRGSDNSNYNLLRTLVVAKLGRSYASAIASSNDGSTVDDNSDETYLIGVFERGVDVGKPESNRSAICIYSISKVKLTFWYNIDRCRSGTGTYSLPHIGRDRTCPNVCKYLIHFSHIILYSDGKSSAIGRHMRTRCRRINRT